MLTKTTSTAALKGTPFAKRKITMFGDCFDDQTPHNQGMGTQVKAGRKIGYVRVSDKDQTEALQLDALQAEGCRKIYTDHGVSGGKVDRPALNALMQELNAGDTLTVWKLDRLGRSTIHLLQILSDLQERGVEFHAITQGIDTRTAVGRMIYGQLAVFAEYERSLISERTKAGMAAAKARGVHVGRPRLSKTMETALDELSDMEVTFSVPDDEIERSVDQGNSSVLPQDASKTKH
ncbi:recombinase family protein [Phaeobacter sp. 11ANDIMAR09]|uniref:recombinase family protein n=1 Tax=Phaeobacter sp. 11ANDIMAR09 TaxID=1225647 RepID=UPI00209D4565|nr:recombinase family protein [Phaeobacter sp. 11ANDIMAR09]